MFNRHCTDFRYWGKNLSTLFVQICVLTKIKIWTHLRKSRRTEIIEGFLLSTIKMYVAHRGKLWQYSDQVEPPVGGRTLARQPDVVQLEHGLLPLRKADDPERVVQVVEHLTRLAVKVFLLFVRLTALVIGGSL